MNRVLTIIAIILVVAIGIVIAYEKLSEPKVLQTSNTSESVQSTDINPEAEKETIKPISKTESTSPVPAPASSGEFTQVFKDTKVGYQVNYKKGFYANLIASKTPENEVGYEAGQKSGFVIIATYTIPDPKQYIDTIFEKKVDVGLVLVNKGMYDIKFNEGEYPKIGSYTLRGFSCTEYRTDDGMYSMIMGECESQTNKDGYEYNYKEGNLLFDPKSIILF